MSMRSAYVLDDEAQIGALVCATLTANNIATRQFTHPIQFLEELKVSPPDLVVLDLSLGQSDAVEVIRQLEALKYKGRVLLMSGRDQATLAEITQIGKRRGLAMLPPLHKPFRAGDLKTILANATDKPEASSKPEALFDVTGAEPQANKIKKITVNPGEALQNNWLELWYQPKIDLESFSVCGAEALLRVRHPEHGILAPGSVLPPAGHPLFRPISNFVIQRAAADWGRFAEQGLPLKLAINLPVSVLHSAGFVEVMRDMMPKHAKFPGLIVELTEDEVIHDQERISEVASQLKLYNILISIDDFGTAHSSLSRLVDIACVELKLDRKFVSNCSSQPLKKELCRTVVDLAHRFDISVCAEGVEQTDELLTMIKIGCDTAQGFYFAKPMSPDKFTDMLITRSDWVNPQIRAQVRSSKPSKNALTA